MWCHPHKFWTLFSQLSLRFQCFQHPFLAEWKFERVLFWLFPKSNLFQFPLSTDTLCTRRKQKKNDCLKFHTFDRWSVTRYSLCQSNWCAIIFQILFSCCWRNLLLLSSASFLISIESDLHISTVDNSDPALVAGDVPWLFATGSCAMEAP